MVQECREQGCLPRAPSAPAFAGSEVSAVFPSDAVLASSAICIINSTTAVGPERVIIAIVGSCLAGGNCLALVVVAWQCQNTRDG